VSADAPSAVFGLPTYNGEQHLAEALDSLLAQTSGDLGIVVVDNCSTDGTPRIARRYVDSDPRVVYERNERMLGLVHNWRRAFELAGEHFPGSPYYAWASDHDVWEPRWLECLEAELAAHPRAVLAFPLCVRIDEAGVELKSREHLFDTAGIDDPIERLRRSVEQMPAGDMIYGLCRREALERTAPFPLVVLPDRLQLARLSLEGEFRQVHLRLWRRRYRQGLTFALGRQRRSFFVEGTPLRAYLPWWAAHTIVFVRAMSGRPRRFRLAAAHLGACLRVELRRREERRERRRGWRRKRRRGFRRRLVGTIRRRLGRAAG
jgi:glycosyltransferase involved in cell wall biosynthesis